MMSAYRLEDNERLEDDEKLGIYDFNAIKKPSLKWPRDAIKLLSHGVVVARIQRAEPANNQQPPLF